VFLFLENFCAYSRLHQDDNWRSGKDMTIFSFIYLLGILTFANAYFMLLGGQTDHEDTSVARKDGFTR